MFKKLKGWFGKDTNKKDSREKTKTELSNQALAAQLAADSPKAPVPDEAELLPSPAAVTEPEAAPPPPAVEPQADCIAIPGDIVLSLFPPAYLIAPVENLVADYGEQTGFIFAQSDLMYGLSTGRLTFSLADVVQKAQLNVFTDELMEIYGQEMELPLVSVVPLIPPAWFVVGQQAQSKQQIVDEMDHLFTDSMTPEAAEEGQDPTHGEREGGRCGPLRSRCCDHHSARSAGEVQERAHARRHHRLLRGSHHLPFGANHQLPMEKAWS